VTNDNSSTIQFGKRRQGEPLSQLPSKLVHADNLDFLAGADHLGARHPGGLAVPFERGLKSFSSQFDLLGMLNYSLTGVTPEWPDVHMHVEMEAERDGQRGVDFQFCMFKPHSCRSASDLPGIWNYYPNDGHRVLPWPSFRLILHWERSGKYTMVQCPLFCVLSTSERFAGKYVVYAHTFADESGRIHTFGTFKSGGRSYVGITKQGWSARWKQHLYAASSGSPYRFHQAIRRALEFRSAESHEIVAAGVDFNEAMRIEEELVRKSSLYPKGLNMIPGGFEGIRYLAKHGFKPNPGKISEAWDRRHVLLQNYAKHCDRTGKPNPLAAALWQDNDYAASVICSNPNNFTLEQVREARYLESLGWETAALAERYQCSEERLRRLLGGETYSRVH
jgi:hypothetical protein